MTRRRRPRAVPWLAPTLRGYRREWLGRDVVAGLSAGAVVIPQAMAYATIADLPVQVGLYTCMVPMLVYAVLGGSRAMSVSTTSTIVTLTATTLVTAGVVAGADDPVGDLVTLTLLVGALLLAARALRLGSVVEYISKATVVGVQIGVGATVAVGQLPKLLGESGDESGRGFVRSVLRTLEALPDADPVAIVFSAVTIAVLVVLKRFARRVPGPLVVVAAGILFVAVTPTAGAGLDLIAAVTGGLPVPSPPAVSRLPDVFPGALAIAVMAFLETSAVARGIRQPDEPAVRSNRELLAIGAANALGALFQSLPAAGGFSQSAVNRDAGARTQLTAVVTAVLAVVVALVLAPVLSLMPQATLASLVLVAVIGIIDVPALLRLWRLYRPDFWVAVLTILCALTAGLLAAVAVGVAGTLVVVFRELNRVRLDAGEAHDGVLAVRVLGPLYTANVLSYTRAIRAAADRSTIHVLALELARLDVVSVTVLDALRELDTDLAARSIALRLCALPPTGVSVAARSAWFSAAVAQGRVYPTVQAAVSDG